MTISRTNDLGEKTEFFIEEPTPYGEPDKRRTVIVRHSLDEISKLPEITQEEIDNLPDNHDEHETAETFEIPEVGTIVFINSFDTEYYSWKYRKGAHDMRGPYLLKG